MQRFVECVIVFLGLAHGFNLSPKHATVISDPKGQTNSYFGYTVNLMGNKKPLRLNSWLIVGAPKANSSLEGHVGLVEPGVVYGCNSAKRWECTPIILDKEGNVPRYEHSFKYKHKKDNAWLGGAVDVQEDSDGGSIVVCGQRWINQRNPEFYLMNGICYVKYFPFNSTEDAFALLPLIKGEQIIKNPESATTDDELFIYGYAETGASVHFTAERKMLIGAPGVRQWTGTTILYKNDADEEYNTEPVVPNPVKTSKLSQYGYFGYSVDSGRFLRSSNKTFYVAGAPREGNLTGKVFVYDFPRTNEEEYKILVERQGTQLGEYFGSCVCAVDLNGDGLDDLLVGAPQHSLAAQGTMRLSGDEGRVYVFINEDAGVLREIGDANLIMGTQVQGARFGTAISKIGDIDKDGFQDIAVGAPYEDSGRGAIYIYHGRSSGIHHKPSQRITAAEIHTSLAGFGMSISRGADVDDNHYNDLAVGAFSSGHVVIIPSQPVIKFHARIDSQEAKIGLKDTGFTGSACLSYSGQYAPKTVEVHVTLQSESIALFVIGSPGGSDTHTNNTQVYQSTLYNGVETCKEFIVEIQSGNHDYRKPIELQLHFKLESQEILNRRRRRETILEPVDFCKTCPVVDPNEKSFITKKIPFAIECGTDNICQTDLSVTASFVNVTQPYVVGTQQKLRMRVLVINNGEQAFLVMLNVSLPQETPLSRLPTICQEVSPAPETRLECDMTHSLEPNGTIVLEMDIDVERVLLTTVDALLVFGFNVSSGGEETAPLDNSFSISLPVKTVADVFILGSSSQDKGILAKGKKTFYHRFEVTNNGPSPLNTLGLEFKIPVALRSSTGETSFIHVYEPTAYFGKQPFQCTTTRGKSASDTEDSVVLNDVEDRQQLMSIDVEDERSVNTQSYLPTNRTLFVNCSSANVRCISVQCNSSGPFVTQTNTAFVSFQLTADFENIGPILGMKDIVSISSVGRVWIIGLPNDVQPSDGRPDLVTVNSVFFGNLPDQIVGSWVLPVSIIGGIIILLLIIAALVKVGFFRRQTPEDLQSLHDDSANKEPESNGVDNSDLF